jgi:hypothetical protein
VRKLIILDNGEKILHEGLFITESSPDIKEEYDISNWSESDFKKAKKDKKHLDKLTKLSKTTNI